LKLKREKLDGRKEKLNKEAEGKKEAGGTTNLELRTIMKQVTRENKILKTQTKPIIAYNNENKAFEYIGEPARLKHDDEP